MAAPESTQPRSFSVGREPKVIVPFTRLHPQVWPALAAAGIMHPRFVELPKWDSYSQLLKELWAEEETFVLVEQDIIIRPGVVEELIDCPEPWCGFLNDVGLGIWPTLGCTKFDATYQRRFPELLERAARVRVANLRAGHWRHMDVAIDRVFHRELEIRGPHPHSPAVVHASFVSLSLDPQCRWCRKRLPITMAEFQAIKDRWSYASCGWCLPEMATWRDRLVQLQAEGISTPSLRA